MTPPPRSRPRTICYLAKSDAAAREGAAALEDVTSGPDRTVQPLSTTAVDQLRNWTPETDCVVFAETPTTAAGANLLEVIDACGATPLVLFTDASYAPTAARSTDGIDGYVRRDTADAVAHLADEIAWVCGAASERTPSAKDGTDSDRVAKTEAESTGTNDGTAEASDETEAAEDTTNEAIAIPMGGAQASTTTQPAIRLLEAVPDAACREREGLFELVVEAAADALEVECGWLSTVHFGSFTPRATTPGIAADDIDPAPRDGPLGEVFQVGEPLLIDGLGDSPVELPLEGADSLCCLPVGDVGILVLAGAPSAFDEDDCELLETWCQFAAAVHGRLETVSSLESERDRLRADRQQLEATVAKLNAERDADADERDRLGAELEALERELAHLEATHERDRALFANVPKPAVRYAVDDGQLVVCAVNDSFADVFDTDDEETVPPGLEHRRATLVEALRAGEHRQLFSRRETVDGVREFRLTVVPLESHGGRHEMTDNGPHVPDDADAPIGESDDADAPANTLEGVIVYNDVTDSNRHERELAATRERLDTVASLLEDEVRPPLNVARGYLELASETGDEAHFAEVDDAQERVRERLEQLVSIARQDNVRIETEPVAIHDVARRAWLTVDTGDARLVTAPGDDRVLEADKTQFRELFEHLLGGVLEGMMDDHDEMPAETATPRVTVGATDDGFSVTGHQPDAEAEAMPQATSVPGQLAAADGTGFGVDPIERIADAHGWEIGVAESEATIRFVFRNIEPATVDGG